MVAAAKWISADAAVASALSDSGQRFHNEERTNDGTEGVS